MTKIWIFAIFIFSSYICDASSVFNDQDLKKIFHQSLKQKDTTYIIYSWSPHMALSLRGLDELIGKKKNTIIVPVLDPDSNLVLAAEIAKKHQWPSNFLRVNESATLIGKGVRIHYPSYSFINNGDFKGALLPGYKTSVELNEFQKRHLK